MIEYQIEWYIDAYFDEWDNFIQKNAINGTLLQTRKFLSYHPKGRFKDCSIIVKNKGTIIAVCPACELFEDGNKIFMSHAGSTYGGLILTSGIYKIENMDQLLRRIECFLRDAGFSKIIFKQTPDLLSRTKNDLLYFCLGYEGYSEQRELNLYIDLEKYLGDIVSNFDQGRRRWIKKCVANKMNLKELKSKDEYKIFHEILTDNLRKYDKKPVHTVEELILLKDILKDDVGFWGIEFDGQITAGAMIFDFKTVECIHTHYLAAAPEYEKYSPMSFLYYSMINYAVKRGYKSVSWGIATDHDGNINWNLCRTKESYGSMHSINRIFVKALN